MPSSIYQPRSHPPPDSNAYFVAPCIFLGERTAQAPPIFSRSEALLSKNRDGKRLQKLLMQPGVKSTWELNSCETGGSWYRANTRGESTLWINLSCPLSQPRVNHPNLVYGGSNWEPQRGSSNEKQMKANSLP